MVDRRRANAGGAICVCDRCLKPVLAFWNEETLCEAPSDDERSATIAPKQEVAVRWLVRVQRTRRIVPK